MTGIDSIQKKNYQQAHAKELDSLNIFIGRWKVEGYNLAAAPLAPDRPVSGEESWEWMAGNYFLVGKWKRSFYGIDHIGKSIIQFDEDRQALRCTNYDNMGYVRCYQVKQEENSWHFIGEKERAKIIFGADGNSFTESWELLTNSSWQPLCVLNGTRVKHD